MTAPAAAGSGEDWRTWHPEKKLRILKLLHQKRRQKVLERWPTPAVLAAALDPSTRNPPHLAKIDEALLDVAEGRCERLMILMPPQEGKELACDTPLVTLTGRRGDGTFSGMGLTTMLDVKVGDVVWGGDGKPCNVVEVHPVRIGLDCYEVEFVDGVTITCSGDHRWRVEDRNNRNRAGSWKVLETREIAKDPRRWSIPATPALQGLMAADLPVDPYVLGLWLGNGSKRSAQIALNRQDAPDIETSLKAAGYTWTTPPSCDRPNHYVINVTGLRTALNKDDLLGDKHIPHRYANASHAQRWALLQGLMDTDGSAYSKGHAYTVCELSFTREVLARDAYRLALGLGLNPTMRSSDAAYVKDGVRTVTGTRWRIRFTTSEPVFRVSRKLARIEGLPRKGRTKIGIKAVRPVPSVPVRCITVDSPDHTFLCDQTLRVTHNSERTSHYGAEWFLLQNPDLRIAIASYELETARRWGQVIRNDLLTFQLPLVLQEDSRAAGRWSIAGHKGGVYCVGIGGALTGRPVDVLIIDDPVKDRAQADSEAYRNAAWNWWTDVARTRLAPDAPVILVMTRWHEDDLGGRILSRPGGEEWRVLRIPAQADHDPAKGETDLIGREVGEYLPSAREWPEGRWEKVHRDIGTRSWEALYQGNPTPLEGDIWKRHWWRRYDKPIWTDQVGGTRVVLPPQQGVSVELIQSWDLAFKDTKSSDYVVGQVWAKVGGDAYLVDQVRDRMDFPATIAAIGKLTARWPQARTKLVEDKANGPAVISSLRKTGYGLVPVEPMGGKEARANAVSPVIEGGNVWLPAPEVAGFGDELVEEAAVFPNGTNDDQVDAASQALARLFLSRRSSILV